MKKILLLAALAVSLVANAQVNKVSLQASGLTCSMCSNAINTGRLDVAADCHVVFYDEPRGAGCHRLHGRNFLRAAELDVYFRSRGRKRRHPGCEEQPRRGLRN